MGLFSWLLRPSAAEKPQCSPEFPTLWTEFVNHFVDVGFSGGTCATPEQAGVTEPSATVLPPAERLVAIGDLHGDLGKARRAFRAAGLTDEQDKWVGGSTVAVQVGDILDRGDAELRILLFLESLQAQARAAGGALHVLNGNHETMNVMGNHRYATSGATREIERWNAWQRLGTRLMSSCNCVQSAQPSSNPPSPPAALDAAKAQDMYGASHFTRTFALQPGSAITKRFFANHPTVLQVGSTVFVHGGVLPHHVEYGINRINRETSEWMRGEQSLAPEPSPGTSDHPATASSGGTALPLQAPSFLRSAQAVVWARDYSAEDSKRCDCAKLDSVLKSMPGASRMVMGHTIQSGGINAACGGKALRVDVGMSKGCGNGDVEVLEIRQDGAQVLRVREGAPPLDITQQVAVDQQNPVQEAASQAAVPPAKVGGVKTWRSMVMPSPSAI